MFVFFTKNIGFASPEAVNVEEAWTFKKFYIKLRILEIIAWKCLIV